jgi:hypothetical protein
VLRFTCRFSSWKYHTRRLGPSVGLPPSTRGRSTAFNGQRRHRPISTICGFYFQIPWTPSRATTIRGFIGTSKVAWILDRKALAVPSAYCFFYSRISRLARPHPGHVLVAISNQQVCWNNQNSSGGHPRAGNNRVCLARTRTANGLHMCGRLGLGPMLCRRPGFGLALRC